MGVEGNDAAEGDGAVASIVFHQPSNYRCFTRCMIGGPPKTSGRDRVVNTKLLAIGSQLRGCFDTRLTDDFFTGNVVAVVERSASGWTSVIAPIR